jgi:hypothetical protein
MIALIVTGQWTGSTMIPVVGGVREILPIAKEPVYNHEQLATFVRPD